MIRINLLPVKAELRRKAGQKVTLLAVFSLAGMLSATVGFHFWSSKDVGIQQAQLSRLRDAITQLKSEVGDYDILKRQRDDLRRQKDAIDRLQAARTGPMFLMRELSDILTKGKGPTFSREQYEETLRRDPNAGFNQSWESKRVWLLSYSERGGSVTLKGAAKSDEDVAEFLKRLKLSAFFTDVYWQQTRPEQTSGVAHVVFDVTCKVNY